MEFRISGKVASGVPKDALLGDFRYHFGRILGDIWEGLG